jgi:hypothetical protein
LSKLAVTLGIMFILCFLPVASAPSAVHSLGPASAPSPSLERMKPAGSNQGAFAFVSNFEDGKLDGWSSLSGKAPTVTTSVPYGGEPSLKSSASQGPQVDTANQGFLTGGSFVSFQVAIDGVTGQGLFGLGTGGAALALVGMSNGNVVAGTDAAHLQTIAPVPVDSAYPAGWVYLTANVYDASTKSNPVGWVMQLFVDRTDQIAATVPVPGAAGYANAIIETLSGTAYYSDLVVSSYQIPDYVPGYNNMEGYGQGSGAFVSLLPAYYNLTAQMDLEQWSTPQVGILSFQINAMNYYGVTRSSCGGFFQLGIDLNPNGYIAPWYVEGKNCIAHYFLNSNSPHIQQGIPSPSPTHLVLSIVFEQAAKQVVFTIVDTTTAQTFTASVPYGGDPFYGMYTQMEFQPCCNAYPISQYSLDGSVYGIQITTLTGARQALTSSYMLPFVLDAPPSWNFGYYQDSTSGYQQVS